MPSVEKVASGLNIVIYAIAFEFLREILLFESHLKVPLISHILFAIVGIISIVGFFRLATGLGYSPGIVMVIFAISWIPFMNLIVLAILNSDAKALLENNGYRVGFFGASLKQSP